MPMPPRTPAGGPVLVGREARRDSPRIPSWSAYGWRIKENFKRELRHFSLLEISGPL